MSDLWTGIGFSLVILSIYWGFGGCIRLVDNRGPIIVIQKVDKAEK